MANIFGASPFRRAIPCILKAINGVKSTTNVIPRRHVLTAPSGAVLPEPKKIPFPFFKIVVILTPGIYVGAAIAKNGATILEENEIFVPSDDDEED